MEGSSALMTTTRIQPNTTVLKSIMRASGMVPVFKPTPTGCTGGRMMIMLMVLSGTILEVMITP